MRRAGSSWRRRLTFAGIGLLTVILAGGVIDVRFGHPVEHALYWWARARMPVADDDIRVTILGDSSAMGIGAARPTESFAGRAVVHLEEVTGRSMHADNLAVGGATAAEVVTGQLPHAELSESDLVLVSVGSTDAAAGLDLARYGEAMSSLLDALPPERTVISDVAAVPGSQPYQTVLARLADERGFRRAPFVSAFEQAQRRDVFAPDGHHLNSLGHEIWFGSFQPLIDEVMVEGPPHPDRR